MTMERSAGDAATISALMFGCGNMGQALMTGWVKVPGSNFTVIDPMKPEVAGATTVGSPDDVSGSFNVAIIAVKPQLIPTIVETAGDLIRSADLILSIAAGVSVETLERQLGHRPIVRMMPNMPASVSLGLSGLYANDKCDDAHREMVSALADQNGEFIWLDEEDKIDHFTAVAGSGPGYVFEILRLYTIAAMEQGFSEEEARKLSIGTLLGSVTMAEQSGKAFEDLRNSVTSKNGTTQAGLEQLMSDGVLETLLKRTMEAAYTRAVELR